MKHLSNNQLLAKVKDLVQQERRIQVEFLRHLREVEERRLFLDIGYGSLFDYVTKELGYSESAGYRRIQAMRLLKSVPEVQEKISNGEMTLTTAAQVQSFIRMETKREGGVSVECKRDLVAAVQSKSSREVEKILISHSPAAALPAERVRALTETHMEVRLNIDEQLRRKLDHLKGLLSHSQYDMNYAELIELLADRELKRSDPELRRINSERMVSHSKPQPCDRTATPAPKVICNIETESKKEKVETQTEINRVASENSKPRQRYIPASIRNQVWKRDGGCCAYVSPEGKKCDSRYQIQFDHIQLYSKGGGHSLENLRLLCANHNRNRAF
ncbi:HNH endonuclease [Bdellovibrio sp. HCB274]|uniref:HNH endonuclease n=1 Tax=Bdellovibrio sp. HCB274 TaxID=3394361 RepID=UPI0039B4F194